MVHEPVTPCLIGLDLGTSTCKALAVDGEGRVLAGFSTGYPMATPRPRWAEQAPADWLAGADRAMLGLVAALPAGTEAQAIGLSGQMHGLVALDDADAVIRPAILWCDNRTGAQCDALTGRLGVAARNDERPDAQSSAVFDADSLRLRRCVDAGYLRTRARSVRRTRDHLSRRRMRETEHVGSRRRTCYRRGHRSFPKSYATPRRVAQGASF